MDFIVGFVTCSGIGSLSLLHKIFYMSSILNFICIFFLQIKYQVPLNFDQFLVVRLFVAMLCRKKDYQCHSFCEEGLQYNLFSVFNKLVYFFSEISIKISQKNKL